MNTGHLARGVAATMAMAFSCFTPQATADDYASHYRDAITAYQASDFSAMQASADRALQERPDYPPMLEIKAIAATLAGQHEVALACLREIADMHVSFDAGREAFSALEKYPAFEKLAERNRELDLPVGKATVAFSGGPGDFVPEGIAADARGNIYLGSIRHGDILRISDSMETIHKPAGRHWSVFGMAMSDESLWFVSSRIPEFIGEDVDDSTAPTGLFRLDIATGELERHFLPGATSLGDLLVIDSVAYLTDSAGGIWKFEAGEFTKLLPPGKLVNPQGIAMISGNLLVADYRGGLYQLDTLGKTYRKVANATQASLYGIDGMIARDGRLYAVQNGITPHRVMEFEYSPARNSIVSARTLLMNHPAFDEPTLLARTHEGLAVVANSHWNRFDENQQLPVGLSPPTVLLVNVEDNELPKSEN